MGKKVLVQFLSSLKTSLVRGAFASASLFLPAKSLAAPKLSNDVPKCEFIFLKKSNLRTKKTKIPESAVAPISEASSNERSLLEQDDSMYSKEQILMQGEFTNYLGSAIIPKEDSAGVDYKKNDDGEFIAVSFLIKPGTGLSLSNNLSNSNNSLSSNNFTRLGNSKNDNAIAMVAASNKQVGVASRPATLTTIDEIRKLGLSPTQIFTNYVLREIGDEKQVDAAAVASIVATLQDDPKLMAEALAYHYSRSLRSEGANFSNAVAVNLANTGEFRYFRFTPSNHNQEVNARVLDIDLLAEPNAGFHVLVEWLHPSEDVEVRTRQIQELSAEELRSLRPTSVAVRKMIEKDFYESLTPYEIKTQRLAALLKLKTFGYTEMSRKETGSPGASHPLFEMSGLAHLRSRNDVESRFGKISDLLTDEESKAEKNWRIFDVMARLTPRYILNRFESRDSGFVYMFVLTEDGQLKIAPLKESTSHFKPELLRLAHGRRIFAGGTFVIEKDGRLKVKLDSNRYQDIQGPARTHFAFRTQGQEGLDALISFAFGLQAGRAVSNLSSAFAQTFYSRRGLGEEEADNLGGDRYAHDSFFRAFSDHRTNSDSGHYAGFGSKESFDFAFEAFDYAGLARSRSDRMRARKLTWQDHLGPLDFKDWIAQAQLKNYREEEMKSDWWHYCLRSSTEMSFEQIRKQYKRAANLFHPDRRNDLPEPEARQLFQRISAAFTGLEQITKK